MPELKIISVIPHRRDQGDDAFPQIREMNLSTILKTPIDAYRSFFNGTEKEYNELLERNSVSWKDFQNITKNQSIFPAELNNFVLRLHKALQASPHCNESLRNYYASNIAKSHANLESVTYDFTSFSQEEFDAIVDQMIQGDEYKTPAMIEFIDYNSSKKTITTYTSCRGLYIDPFTKKLETSIFSRGKGEVTIGLNGSPSVVDGFHKKSWTMLENAKFFMKFIKDNFDKDYSVALKIPNYREIYYESDVFNKEPDENELFVKQIADHADTIVKSEIPRGSLSPNTSEAVIEKLNAEAQKFDEDEADESSMSEEDLEKNDELDHTQEHESKISESESQTELSEPEKAVENLESDVVLQTEQQRQAYFHAKRKQLEEAEKNIPRAVEVFKEAIMKGADLLKAFDMVDQTFKNNPYIREAVSTEIKNELLGVVAKEKVIFGLREAIALKNIKIDEERNVVTVRDNEIASLLKEHKVKDAKYDALVLEREQDVEKFETLLEKTNKEVEILKSENTQLESDLETSIQAVDEFRKTVNVLENENSGYKKLIPQLEGQTELLKATIESKETLLQAQISRNELLEKNNTDLADQLKALQELNKTKEAENKKLKEDLETSKTMLREAQKALEQAKENERIEAGKVKNVKRANYTMPLEKHEIQKALDEAPSGSLSSSRLRLVRDGKLDFSKIEANTPEAQKIVENAKADFEALEAKGLLTCKDGIYRLKDDQARSVLYHMNDAKIDNIADEYESIQYSKTREDESAQGSYKKGSYANRPRRTQRG